jgi:hypothetical protein
MSTERRKGLYSAGCEIDVCVAWPGHGGEAPGKEEGTATPARNWTGNMRKSTTEREVPVWGKPSRRVAFFNFFF